MIDPFLFAKGFALGVAIAAPVGPIGILCIRRTLVYGRAHGAMTGIGAALGDGVYGIIAAFGMVALGHWLISLKTPLHLIGAVAIAAFGVNTLLTAGRAREEVDNGRSIAGASSAALSSFLLTLTNPMTVVSFITAFTAIGLPDALSFGNGAVLVGGVIAGSLAWFLTLSSIVLLTGHALSRRALLWIDRVAGMLLLLFAAYLLVSIWLPGFG